TAVDDGGRIVARTAADGGTGACVARAAQLPWGVAAVGHLDARMAGGARRTDVPDPHDRRCQQRVDGALCALGFHRGEHAVAVGLPGTQRPAGSVLYRQSESVSDGTEGIAGSTAVAAGRVGSAAAHADWAGSAGVGNRVDCSA